MAQSYTGQAPDWALFQRDPAAYAAWQANQAAVANAVADDPRARDLEALQNANPGAVFTGGADGQGAVTAANGQTRSLASFQIAPTPGPVNVPPPAPPQQTGDIGNAHAGAGMAPNMAPNPNWDAMRGGDPRVQGGPYLQYQGPQGYPQMPGYPGGRGGRGGGYGAPPGYGYGGAYNTPYGGYGGGGYGAGAYGNAFDAYAGQLGQPASPGQYAPGYAGAGVDDRYYGGGYPQMPGYPGGGGRGQQPGMMYAGGSSSFDERTGQYRSGPSMGYGDPSTQRYAQQRQATMAAAGQSGQQGQPGMVYGGGSATFDEHTGQYRQPGQAPTNYAAQRGQAQPYQRPGVPLAHQVNPMVWDSLGPVGKELAYGAIGATGQDPGQYEYDLNQSRPRGSSLGGAGVRYAQGRGGGFRGF